MRWLVFALIAGCAPVPQEDTDCLPTLGEHCDCEPKCMTQHDIDQIDEFCDLGCDTEAEALDWQCQAVEGECRVVR